MTVVGFHASHEQVPPADLLTAVQAAEKAGFTAAMCSDHFSPWSARQGESGFAWSWLGAALATTSLPFGVVNAPGQRYHPAIIAQASATLASMFPGRFWAALGTGEASNEHITGDRWPRKDVRNERLRECVDIIRALHRGEEVSHEGLVRVDRARLWTLPPEPPLLLGPAISVETAGWVAGWADGLITIQQPHDHLRQMVDAYRDAGGRGRTHLQVHLSWDPDETDRTGHRLRPVAQQRVPAACLLGPRATRALRRGQRASSGRRACTGRCWCPVTWAGTRRWLNELVQIGFDEIYLHHVGREQLRFIDAFGTSVLPELGITAKPR